MREACEVCIYQPWERTAAFAEGEECREKSEGAKNSTSWELSDLGMHLTQVNLRPERPRARTGLAVAGVERADHAPSPPMPAGCHATIFSSDIEHIVRYLDWIFGCSDDDERLSALRHYYQYGRRVFEDWRPANTQI